MPEKFESTEFNSDEELPEDKKSQSKPIEGGSVDKNAVENLEEFQEEALIKNKEKEKKEKRTPVYLENGLDNWLKLANQCTTDQYIDKGMSDDWLINKSPLIYYFNSFLLYEGDFGATNDWIGRVMSQTVPSFKEDIQKIENWKKENNCPIEDFDVSSLLNVEKLLVNHKIMVFSETMPPYLELFQKYIDDVEDIMGKEEIGKIRNKVNQIMDGAANKTEREDRRKEVYKFIEEKIAQIHGIENLKKDAADAGESLMVKDIPSRLVKIYCDLTKYRNKCEMWARENNKEIPLSAIYFSVEVLFNELRREARLNHRLMIPDFIEEKIKENGINKEVMDFFNYERLAMRYYRKPYEIDIQNKVNIGNIPSPNEIYVILNESLIHAIKSNYRYTKESGLQQESIKINNTEDNRGIVVTFKCFPEESIKEIQKEFKNNRYLSIMKKWKIEWEKVDTETVEIKIWYEDFAPAESI